MRRSFATDETIANAPRVSATRVRVVYRPGLVLLDLAIVLLALAIVLLAATLLVALALSLRP